MVVEEQQDIHEEYINCFIRGAAEAQDIHNNIEVIFDFMVHIAKQLKDMKDKQMTQDITLNTILARPTGGSVQVNYDEYKVVVKGLPPSTDETGHPANMQQIFKGLCTALKVGAPLITDIKDVGRGRPRDGGKSIAPVYVRFGRKGSADKLILHFKRTFSTETKDLTIKDLCNRIRRKAGGNAPTLEKRVIKEEQNGASAPTEVGYNL